jgi:hypothetical protein
LLKTAGRWPWKSEPAKECVTTHLPKQPALKMDGAKASYLYFAVELELALVALTTQRVGRSNGWRGRLWERSWLEPPIVQILVVVANTPERPWRTDVEKVFV